MTSHTIDVVVLGKVAIQEGEIRVDEVGDRQILIQQLLEEETRFVQHRVFKRVGEVSNVDLDALLADQMRATLAAIEGSTKKNTGTYRDLLRTILRRLNDPSSPWSNWAKLLKTKPEVAFKAEAPPSTKSPHALPSIRAFKMIFRVTLNSCFLFPAR